MENRRQQILDEIISMMSSIRNQVDELESKVSELRNIVDCEEVEESEAAESVDVAVVRTESVEDAGDDDFEPVDMEFMDIDLSPAPDLYPSQTEPEPSPVVSDEEHDLFPESPAPAVEPVVEPAVAPAVQPVIDALYEKQAWRTDIPGLPVKDIRSAISLNDRILFINHLFHEDPMVFQTTLTQLNAMQSFDEAVSYVVSQHPEWNLESDTVYRFMMALRRRLQ